MATDSELEGIDAAWLAIDELGQVAVFTTAGQGPVPKSALPLLESAEADILCLPASCEATRVMAVPRPDSFVAFAERGLFAYDWSGSHRTSSGAISGYELAAAPRLPVRTSQLPASLQPAASATCIPGIEFGNVSVVPASLLGT